MIDNKGSFVASPRMLAQLESWRRDLVNLNRTNRLLYFRPSKTSTLSLAGRTPDELFLGLQAPSRPGWGFQIATAESLAPGHVRTDKEDVAKQDAALRLLERRAAQEFLDKGLSVLYVALGMLSWQEPDDDRVALSPLVLVPVTLSRSSPREPYRVRRVEDDLVVNPALQIKLETEFGVQLPDFETGDEGALEPYFRSVEEATGWIDATLSRSAVLAPFSFHKEVMFRDLQDNAEQILEHPIVGALADSSVALADRLAFDPVPDERLDVDAPPEDMASVLAADSSQRRCIVAARQGRSFVMDGPPGTGKSQTITNIIAELLREGRSVLFVSEKAAALEVVRSRLDAAGLGGFVLELHSHKATRKEVAQELGRSLAQRIVVNGPELAAQDKRAALRRREQLTEYAQAMNEARPETGTSLHETLGRLAQLAGAPQVTRPSALATDLTPDTVADVVAAAGALARAWGPVTRGDDFLWADAVGPRPRATLFADMSEGLSRLARLSEQISEQTRLPREETPRGLRERLPLLQLLAEPAPVPDDWLTATSLAEVVEARDHLSVALQEHGKLTELLIERAGHRYRDLEAWRLEPCARALDTLEAIGWSGARDVRSSQLKPLLQFLAESATSLHDLQARALRAASLLGLHDQALTLHRAEQVAQVGVLSGAAHRPESSWLDPLAQESLTRASSVLEALVDDYRSRQASLAEIFTDDVLLLDAAGLDHRFKEEHRWYKRMGGRYREDKRKVASVLRPGTSVKVAKAHLADAAAWKALSTELEAAEEVHAGALGPAYYKRTATDFDAVRDALEVARQVVELLGRDVSSDGLVARISREGARDGFLPAEARTLLDDIEAWEQSAKKHLGSLPEGATMVELSAWCTHLHDLLEEVGNHLEHVNAVSELDVPADGARVMLQERSVLAALEAEHAPDAGDVVRLLGPRYQGLVTDLAALDEDLSWTTDVRRLLLGPVSPRTARQLLVGRPDAQRLSNALDHWHKLRDELVSLFDVRRHSDLRTELDGPYDDVSELLEAMDQSSGDIAEWLTFASLRQDLSRRGLAESIQDLVDQKCQAVVVAAALETALLEAHVDRVMATDSRLAVPRSTDRDALVAEFQALDRLLLNTASASVVAAVNSRRPRGTAGVAGTIVKEAAKKTRHMPVRKLLSETAAVAQKLKPCFMMSPLTVSQFLTSDVTFDVVIFDEASQVLPADAINCVYRGTQLIVAGDQKQLPPTAFFVGTSREDEEYDESAPDDFESLLDLCKGSGGFNSLPLSWHYRSQHESLITYSNYSFYDGELITFPGANDTGPDVGVELRSVPDGVYRRGGPRDNPKEAAVVVDLVLEHARLRPSLSCGVVALSEAQAAAIEVELERRRTSLPELDEYFASDRLNGFFVKNLESVQGDERDIIVFSIGYGRDEAGKLTNNFGPINRGGGWRRLNVAATRARRRVDVVSSIVAGDIVGTTNESVLHLKRYLDYAQRGLPALAVNVEESAGGADSPFEEEVAAKISSWGYDVVPQVGSAGYRIDIGVRHPERPGSFALGVECDGVMYHSAKVARDRDRLREEVLRGLGWQLHRIWGTGWYGDRPREEERLRQAIRDAVSGSPTVTRPIHERPHVEVLMETVDLDEAPSWAQPYVVFRPRAAYGDITDPMSRPDLMRVIRQVVSAEGPVHRERLLRRVRETFGVGRAGTRVRAAFEDGLLRCLREGTVEASGAFLLSPGFKVAVVRVPDAQDEESRRKVEEVPRQELQLAIHRYVQDAHSIGREQLVVGLARLFGWGRTGGEIRTALDEAIDEAVRGGPLKERAGQIFAS